MVMINSAFLLFVMVRKTDKSDNNWNTFTMNHDHLFNKFLMEIFIEILLIKEIKIYRKLI